MTHRSILIILSVKGIKKQVIKREEVQKWIDKLISELTESNLSLKVVMSNPVLKSSYQKRVITTNPQTSKEPYSVSEYSKTQCFTKTLNLVQLQDDLQSHWQSYKQVLVQLPTANTQILYNGKSKVTLRTESSNNANLITKVDKHYLVPKTAPFLRGLGITTTKGEVKHTMYGKYRQTNKFVEILSATLKSSDLPNLKIYDFGCGKGYLTMAIHHYLQSQGHHQIETIGIDLKESVIESNRRVAAESGLVNLTFTYSDITQIEMQKASVLIALHACDIATDIAIHKGISSQAKYIIVSPCCHKQLRKSMSHHEVTHSITQHGILLERQAEILTDTIRCLLLESAGYRTDIFEFVSTEHTSKNLMIRAVYTGNKKDNTEKIAKLKSIFTLSEPQYLEQLLATDME